MTAGHVPAPKRPRRRRDMVGLTLPPGALALVDALVGTFVGSTRSDVLRYVVISWLTDHHAFVRDVTAETRP
jgi:hypothetical protein